MHEASPFLFVCTKQTENNNPSSCFSVVDLARLFMTPFPPLPPAATMNPNY